MADPPGPTTTSRLAVWALVALAAADVLRTVLAVGHYEQRIDSVTHGNLDPITPALYAYLLLDHLSPTGVEPSTVGRQVWFVVALVAGAAFIAWLYQASRTAQRLAGASTWAPGWAVGGWFIPIANLAIPYLVVRDLHRASDIRPPDQARDLHQASDIRPPDQMRDPHGGGDALPPEQVLRSPRRQPEQRIRIGRWWTLVLLTVACVVVRWLYDLTTARGGALHGTQADMRFVTYPLWTITTILFVRTANRSVRLVREVWQGLGSLSKG
ncbi:hypothetical protein Ais01nite_04990 [Asanoa ishikariensis]|uniref:DUF4328 domain-containing protein n=1 Tax=Asanoa ishikariensis TaxID=137265 RepID=A0A1H3TGN6_9ACTN|nr:DUF4328 domain-containing protein [Asanoa ishikariensis]GIF62464.1 hypothetical protein Ais01nite_04990 [Asanoa ishikariensis]SDZ49453.1 protein of unknown function [Asanoa ishikariensis]